ncbi:DUF779 domain-containing protein [Psychroflexus maritimus]|uniref:DUF779 domain-containing protein n=1 Tax=Psychroflexus maritimus TaxID=2714865 RepID=A0A967AJH7_9FLAO|nr:DUF779 domain-containing protein [Psychroflexus maritimus]NGZ89519.1 DUF779 domain-containing protein [Psychroflexus maritimus]
MEVKKVDITENAEELVHQLKQKHGEVIFHQSGGCCDGSSPMLLPKDDFYMDDSDIHLGSIAGVDFYMNEAQYEYWKHTHLTIDVTSGRGSSFSLEIPEGYRFIVHSRLFTEEEKQAIKGEK